MGKFLFSIVSFSGVGRKVSECTCKAIEIAFIELNKSDDIIFTLSDGFVDKEMIMEKFCDDNENTTLVDSLFIYGKYFIDTNENSDETSNDNASVFKLCYFPFIDLRVNDIDYYIINSHTCKYAVFRSRNTTTHTEPLQLNIK